MLEYIITLEDTLPSHCKPSSITVLAKSLRGLILVRKMQMTTQTLSLLCIYVYNILQYIVLDRTNRVYLI